MTKPILCLDFDGVIHSYSSGWKGATNIPDGPVPGALEFIKLAQAHFTVAIFSSRSHQEGGIGAMQVWMSDWCISLALGSGWIQEIQWPTVKPSAFVTIDDRALTFDGAWPAIEKLLAFQPWNKRSAVQSRFGEGALVCLKSGGPLMTCEAPRSSDNLVSTVWFGADGRCYRDIFHPDQLRALVESD